MPAEGEVVPGVPGISVTEFGPAATQIAVKGTIAEKKPRLTTVAAWGTPI
jgi:hypothetical protein